jgi:hypothetical protein
VGGLGFQGNIFVVPAPYQVRGKVQEESPPPSPRRGEG